MKKIRVRFAPSPTGYLHIGGARTALFNYLYAKKNNGEFILRIEDTDQERFVDGSVEQIINSLKWLGLEWDEGPDKDGKFGPYYQSQRLNIYQKYVEKLIENGKAYYCFCSPERLEKMREEQKNNNLPIKYDKKCMDLSKQEIQKKLENKEPYVIRMDVPTEGICKFFDDIRGEVKVPYENVDDQVLIKSDGFPTYHFANVIDDHFMEITNVIRGEEWLVSTPKHLLLYSFFGWDAPKYAHLPLLLNSDRSKLSKRQNDVSVSDYIEKGYLPDAVINFISLLGWNPGTDQEFFEKKELIEKFSMKRVGKAGSVFDIKKLNWMNGNYIRKLMKSDCKNLSEKLKNILIKFNKIDKNFPDEKLAIITNLLGDKIETLNQILDFSGLLFEDKFGEVDEEVKEYIESDEFKLSKKIMNDELEKLDELDNKNLMNIIKKIQTEAGIKGKKLYTILRILITGKAEGPDLALLYSFFGKVGILKRIENFK